MLEQMKMLPFLRVLRSIVNFIHLKLFNYFGNITNKFDNKNAKCPFFKKASEIKATKG
jgi:hypothetical protein